MLFVFDEGLMVVIFCEEVKRVRCDYFLKVLLEGLKFINEDRFFGFYFFLEDVVFWFVIMVIEFKYE